VVRHRLDPEPTISQDSFARLFRIAHEGSSRRGGRISGVSRLEQQREGVEPSPACEKRCLHHVDEIRCQQLGSNNAGEDTGRLEVVEVTLDDIENSFIAFDRCRSIPAARHRTVLRPLSSHEPSRGQTH